MTKIITDAKKLDTHVNATLKAYTEVGANLHIDIVSAIWQACKFGNPDILNKIYNGLRQNDQTAVKLYVRRATIITGMTLSGDKAIIDEAMPSATLNSFLAKGKTLDFKDQKFIVLQDTGEQREALMTLCDTRFIEPSEDMKDEYVLNRDNIKEIKTIGDDEALSGVARALKNVLENTSDRRVVHLSPAVKKLLTKVQDEVNMMKKTREQQASLATETVEKTAKAA